MRQNLTRLILSIVSTLWPLAMETWDTWGIQLLVLVSFIFQIFLVHMGARRRYYYQRWVRFFIWASYLLASSIATIALGKLTVVTIRNPQDPEYNIELQALLAPLLLMHVANPDSISAYSIEDTRMGSRHGLNLLVQVGVVIWILIRCFDSSSPISIFLYTPLFIAGVIKPLVTIFALILVYDDTTNVSELNNLNPKRWDNQEEVPDSDNSNDPTASDRHHVLMAYYRFKCLQPHRVNWIYHSAFVDNWMSIDKKDPKIAFTITEIELRFVYDAIYTHTPILCTKGGLLGRGISIICLVSTLIGFSIIFRNAFLIDSYVVYTYAILIGSIIVELYQIVTLPFSYTAIMSLWELSKKHECEPKCRKILNSLVTHCKAQKIWSNSLPQLNLVEYCLKDIFIPKPISFILGKLEREMEKKVRKYWGSNRAMAHVMVCPYLKEAIINTMKELEGVDENQRGKRKLTPFEGRGSWTLEDFQKKRTDNYNVMMKYFVDREFDKCIIIWHLATDILLLFSNDSSISSSMSSCCDPSSSTTPNPSPDPCSRIEMVMVSKLLSNYMMYLLMDRPYMLSLTTGEITLGYASSLLKALANNKKIPKWSSSSNSQEEYKQQLLKAIMEVESPTLSNQTQDYNTTFIVEGWDVFRDVQEVVTELKRLDNCVKWKLISGIWIEMLCYAASKSQVNQHMAMIRKGGELITHVWLLLLHKTNSFPYPPRYSTTV